MYLALYISLVAFTTLFIIINNPYHGVVVEKNTKIDLIENSNTLFSESNQSNIEEKELKLSRLFKFK